MSQIARGVASFWTKSASEEAPVAPCFAESGDGVGGGVKDDAVVAGFLQAEDHACAHASESDHS
jgi:hypothetical protein